MPICSDCGIELTTENTYLCRAKRNRYLCKKCDNERVYRWRRENPEKQKEHFNRWRRRHADHVHQYQLKYSREHYLQYNKNGKTTRIKVKKRPYPDSCELCEANRRLSWHHWDDEHREYGVWVCFQCHQVAEAVDAGTIIIIMAAYRRKRL